MLYIACPSVLFVAINCGFPSALYKASLFDVILTILVLYGKVYACVVVIRMSTFPGSRYYLVYSNTTLTLMRNMRDRLRHPSTTNIVTRNVFVASVTRIVII